MTKASSGAGNRTWTPGIDLELEPEAWSPGVWLGAEARSTECRNIARRWNVVTKQKCGHNTGMQSGTEPRVVTRKAAKELGVVCKAQGSSVVRNWVY